MAAGYRGRVFCTPGTRDLCTLVLPDAGRIQEEDARAGQPARLLEARARRCRSSPKTTRSARSTQLQPVGFDRPVPVAPGVAIDVHRRRPPARLRGRRDDAARRAARILFGGDLGRYGRPVLPDPTPVARGRRAARRVHLRRPRPRARRRRRSGSPRSSREHDRARRQGDHPVVRDRPRRGGALLAQAARGGAAHPVVPVYVDSPMAVEALQFYVAARERARRRSIAPAEPARWRAFATRRVPDGVLAAAVHGADRARRTPAIVISSSGMATGGRVLHHLRRALPDAKNTVLFVGYQAAGHARARARRRRARGEDPRRSSCPVAARIERIDSMSAHADAGEILRWLRGFTPPAAQHVPRPRRAAGAGRAAASHRRRARSRVATHAPEHLESVEISVPRDTSSRRRVSMERRTLRDDAGHAAAGADARAYLLERVGEAAVVQLYADGFAQLSLRRQDPRAGTSTRRRSPGATSTTTSATPTTSRCATCSRRSSAHPRLLRPGGRSSAITALHEAVLDQHRPVQQPHGAQVRARPARREALRAARCAPRPAAGARAAARATARRVDALLDAPRTAASSIATSTRW